MAISKLALVVVENWLSSSSLTLASRPSTLPFRVMSSSSKEATRRSRVAMSSMALLFISSPIMSILAEMESRQELRTAAIWKRVMGWLPRKVPSPNPETHP